MYGELVIPSHWQRDLEGQALIKQMSDDLCDYPEWNLDDEVQSGKVWERYPGW
jgi:hypothetical protein